MHQVEKIQSIHGTAQSHNKKAAPIGAAYQ
jgi:hypothetical protein